MKIYKHNELVDTTEKDIKNLFENNELTSNCKDEYRKVHY